MTDFLTKYTRYSVLDKSKNNVPSQKHRDIKLNQFWGLLYTEEKKNNGPCRPPARRYRSGRWCAVWSWSWPRRIRCWRAGCSTPRSGCRTAPRSPCVHPGAPPHPYSPPPCCIGSWICPHGCRYLFVGSGRGWMAHKSGGGMCVWTHTLGRNGIWLLGIIFQQAKISCTKITVLTWNQEKMDKSALKINHDFFSRQVWYQD